VLSLAARNNLGADFLMPELHSRQILQSLSGHNLKRSRASGGGSMLAMIEGDTSGSDADVISPLIAKVATPDVPVAFGQGRFDNRKNGVICEPRCSGWIIAALF